MSLTGACLCGEIKYEITQPLGRTAVCHCKNCQRAAGSAYSTVASIVKADFNLISGTPKLFTDWDTKSGRSVERYFCGNCGSPIYSAVAARPDMIFLKTGTMDDTSHFTPQFQVWCDSKQHWVVLDESLPISAEA